METIAVLVLLALRIGLPLLAILGISYLIYRRVGQEQTAAQAKAEAQRVTIGGPAPVARVLYTGPFCWEAKGCSQEAMASCPAHARPELPCWLALQLKTGHLKKECPECMFYEAPRVSMNIPMQR